jgi:hypothetical protein
MRCRESFKKSVEDFSVTYFSSESKIHVDDGRSSDLLRCSGLPMVCATVAGVEQSIKELTATGIVPELHRVPF